MRCPSARQCGDHRGQQIEGVAFGETCISCQEAIIKKYLRKLSKSVAIIGLGLSVGRCTWASTSAGVLLGYELELTSTMKIIVECRHWTRIGFSLSLAYTVASFPSFLATVSVRLSFSSSRSFAILGPAAKFQINAPIFFPTKSQFDKLLGAAFPEKLLQRLIRQRQHFSQEK